MGGVGVTSNGAKKKHLPHFDFNIEGVMVQWCHPVTLQEEKLSGQGLSIMTLHHGLDQCFATSAIPIFGTKNHSFTFTSTIILSISQTIME